MMENTRWVTVLIIAAAFVLGGCAPRPPAAGDGTPTSYVGQAAVDASSSQASDTEKAAMQKAAAYLDMSGFSKAGLIKQLTFDGFSEADADHAIDRLDPDWGKEAIESAKAYLKLGTFPSDTLADQLAFEGFTQSEIDEALSAVGR